MPFAAIHPAFVSPIAQCMPPLHHRSCFSLNGRELISNGVVGADDAGVVPAVGKYDASGLGERVEEGDSFALYVKSMTKGNFTAKMDVRVGIEMAFEDVLSPCGIVAPLDGAEEGPLAGVDAFMSREVSCFGRDVLAVLPVAQVFRHRGRRRRSQRFVWCRRNVWAWRPGSAPRRGWIGVRRG